jgi:hypothetical protein
MDHTPFNIILLRCATATSLPVRLYIEVVARIDEGQPMMGRSLQLPRRCRRDVGVREIARKGRVAAELHRVARPFETALSHRRHVSFETVWRSIALGSCVA